MRLLYHETSESKLFDETKSLNSHCLLLKGQVTLLFLYIFPQFGKFFLMLSSDLKNTKVLVKRDFLKRDYRLFARIFPKALNTQWPLIL